MSQVEHVWYYVTEGVLGTTQNVGPVPEAEIVSLARESRINHDTLVSSPTRTKGGWVAAKQIPGLLRAFQVGDEERKASQERVAQERIAKQEAKAAERKTRQERAAVELKSNEEERAKQRTLALTQQNDARHSAEMPIVLPPHQQLVVPSVYPQHSYPAQINLHVQQPSQAAHSLGIGSVILGIVSFLVCWIPFIGFFLGGLGLLLGIIGLVLAFARNGTGVGFAIAGSAISSISVIVGLFYLTTLMGVAERATSIGSGSSNSLVSDEDGRDAQEHEDYIKNYLVLYDVEAKYFDTFLDKEIPGVTFKLRNTGERPLDEVEVTVYFKDESGTVIFEEDYHPVLVTEYSFGDNKPLKPGHIWQVERDKFYKAESVPSEWKEGLVEAKITSIRFSERDAK